MFIYLFIYSCCKNFLFQGILVAAKSSPHLICYVADQCVLVHFKAGIGPFNGWPLGNDPWGDPP